MRHTLLLLVLLMLVIPTVYSLSISIGEAKVILRADVPDGQIVTIDRSMRIKNPNDIPVMVNLEPSGGYKRIIELADNNFVLQPNETKRAYFKIVLRSGGRYEGKILVSFKPENSSSKEMPIGFSSTIVIVANGTVTQDYYDAMNSTEDNKDEEKKEPVDLGDEEIPENASFSLDTTPSDKNVSSGKASPIIGIVLVAVIVILGAIIFFIIRRLLK